MGGSDSPTEPIGAPPAQPSRLRAVTAVLLRGLPLVVAGGIGAGIAFGIVAAVDSDEGTLVVEPSAATGATPGQASSVALSSTDEGLTVQEIYQRVGPGVVQIAVRPHGRGLPDALRIPEREGLGSGFVIDKAGHIVTSYHVVRATDEIDVIFSGGEGVPATIVGTDPSTDIAVLDVEMSAGALTPLPLGDSDEVQVGDPVVAIGNPFGLDRTVTAGIVSAIQREIHAPNGVSIEHVIQTDAQINRGSSGGPLLNARGEVIGVNSQIETGGTGLGNVGIGFAVPVNTVREVAAQLMDSGTVERAFVGITMQTVTEQAAQTLRLPAGEGVLIARVLPASPAAEAGLRGGDTTVVVNGQTWVLGGDLIVKADGEAIETAEQLQRVVLGKRPGDTLTLEINRDGETLTKTIQLGRQPTTPTG